MSDAVIVLDGDDTLWETEPLYDNALAEAARFVAGQGLDDRAWLQAQRQRDLHNVVTMGLSRQRFPTSCVEAYRHIAAAGNVPVTSAAEAAIRRIAELVFALEAGILPGVAKAVEQAARHVPVVLLTAGDPLVQERRIEDSGLAPHFSEIRIVPRKSESIFTELLREVGASAAASWSVGNSLPSDINPALRAGLNAVWLPVNVWPFEQRETRSAPGTLLVAKSLPEAIDAVLARICPPERLLGTT
jgi:putative hydrolase of the HAD superfamily